jgi:adenylate cyclase
MFSLLYREDGVPQRHTLEPGETIVGRSAGCGLSLDDPSVSRRHARLVVRDDRLYVGDYGSRNGTYVNQDPVTDDVEVEDGAVIMFGTVPVEVEQSAEDHLSLSDDRSVIDSPHTVSIPLAQTGRLSADRSSDHIDGRRLLAMVSEISRTLIRPQPLFSVLTRVVELAFGAVPAERGFLMLADPGTATLVPRVALNRDGSHPQKATVSRTVLSRVISDRVALLASDAQVDTRLQSAESIHAGNVRSFMCAPLWNQNEVIGAFYVDNPYTNEFAPADLEVFTALADYASTAIDQARLSARVLEETRRRERLQRYHSPAVVDRIIQGGDESTLSLIAQERDVTIVFADIVGFTPMAETMMPVEVTRILNRYLTRMSDVIFEYEGTLDKFIGDAILTVFGAPLDQPDHALRAVRAARAMREALNALNKEHPEHPLEIRVGVNSGPVTAGDVGSPRRREYTVLGDTVNTCARLQSSVCKPGQIVVSRATYDRVRDDVEASPLGSFKVKGRQKPVEVFAV